MGWSIDIKPQTINNMNTIELIRETREKYGDTAAQLAVRLNVSETAIKAWEKGKSMQKTVKLLLEYALKYELTIKPEVSDQFLSMSTPQKIETLQKNFGDNIKQFAARMGVHAATVWRWNKGENPTGAQLRFIFEAAAYPERFTNIPKSFKK